MNSKDLNIHICSCSDQNRADSSEKFMLSGPKAKGNFYLIYQLGLLLFVALASMHARAGVLHSIGVARDTGNDALRYIEHHQYLDDGRHLVRYFNPELELMVRKELTYPDLPQHPLIAQKDMGTGREIRSRRLNNSIIMEVDDPSGQQLIELKLSNELIIDAGFDAFIKSNWEQLIAVGEQSRPFAVAGQSRLLKITIEAESSTEQKGAHFRIVPHNWLARLFVGSLALVYDDARRLVSYRGYSNLKLEPRQSRAVHIKFNHYEMQSELERPLSQWLPDQ